MRSNLPNLVNYHRYKNLNRNDNRDQGPGHPVAASLLILIAHALSISDQQNYLVSNSDDNLFLYYIFSIFFLFFYIPFVYRSLDHLKIFKRILVLSVQNIKIVKVDM